MSDKDEKKRISVTMTKGYLDGFDQLIKKGIYLNRGTAILQGIRMIFKLHGIDPFTEKEPPKEG